MAKDNNWQINIKFFNGYVNAWFENSYPFFGNKNMSSSMVDINLIDPNVLTQGPGTADLTAGTQTGAVTTLITKILPIVTSTDKSFAFGGAELYEINATTVTNTGNFPYTITGAGTIVGQDLIYYKGKLLYSYLDGTTGKIGSYDLSSTFVVDYWAGVLGGTALGNNPHYMIQGGDDIIYITNGQYIATLDDTTAVAQGLAFWDDAQTVSLAWNNDKVIVAVNRPNVSGSNFNLSGIYTWDGITSWDSNPINVNGQIGALYTKNGVTFVWWKDSTQTGGYNLGFISGGQLENIRRFSGSLPNQNQVGEYNGHLMFVSSNKVYLWGARDKELPVKLFQYISGKHATIGAIGTPFGDLLVSSNLTTSYALSKGSGYSIGAKYSTIAFDVSDSEVLSSIDTIQVRTEALATGAKLDTTLKYNQAISTQALTQIAYVAGTKTRHKILTKTISDIEDFRLDLSWANGSATNPVKVRSILIKGKYNTYK